jgi:poly(3-hydroxybutyrate) depolymerase
VSPLVGALIALAVLVLAALLVWTIQAIRRQEEVTPPTSAPTTSRPGVPGTTQPTGPTQSTSRPSSGRRTDDGALVSSCHPYPQPFPLSPLGCTVLSPPNIKVGEKLPFVVMLHGFNTSPNQEMTAGDWDAAVVRDRVIVAFPESNAASWNAGACCGLSQGAGANDVAYLQKLVTDAKARPEIDPSRVFMVGNSNGGMMTYRYICDHADELAGAASVEGTRVVGCTPTTPIPFLHVAGRADEVVPYLGGQSLVSWVLGVTFQGVESSVREFAAASGCSGEPSTRTTGAVTRAMWRGCAGGSRVELDSIAGWPHRWPNGRAYDATTEVMSFFGLGR